MSMIDGMIEYWRSEPGWRVLAGVGMLYVAAKAALDAMVDARSTTASRLAWTMTLPIGVMAGTAMLLGRSEVAVGLLMAASVASLSLVCGLGAFLSPVEELPGVARRVWVFLIPLAMLALVAGFGGHLTLNHAAFFALQGGIIYYVRTDPVAAVEDDLPPALLDAQRPARGRRVWRVLESVMAAAVVMVAGWLLLGSTGVSRSPLVRFSDALVAAAVISPILLLPMTGTASALAQRHRTATVAHAGVLLTVLNLCVMLPGAIMLWYARPMLGWAGMKLGWLAGEAGAFPMKLATPPVFPMSSWRIDSVVLLILAIAALPVALGRLPLGRREGMGLIVLYAVYLVASALVGTRF